MLCRSAPTPSLWPSLMLDKADANEIIFPIFMEIFVITWLQVALEVGRGPNVKQLWPEWGCCNRTNANDDELINCEIRITFTFSYTHLSSGDLLRNEVTKQPQDPCSFFRCSQEAHGACRYLGWWRLVNLFPQSSSFTFSLKLWWQHWKFASTFAFSWTTTRLKKSMEGRQRVSCSMLFLATSIRSL